MEFFEKLNSAIEINKSLLCIGLDPDPLLIPEGVNILEFNMAIISATADLVCAYKPNFAFYEANGAEGIDALKKTIEFIPENIPVIGDAKRGDIGNTAKAYARAVFDYFGCDAITVNPYLGFDSLEPFINYREKGVFILCRTSNTGAADFQSLPCNIPPAPRHLFEIVARKASEWNSHHNIGLVVGATYPDELRLIRQDYPEMVLLVPGVGTQGGDLKKVVRYGVNMDRKGMIINSSRQVLYASKEEDFAAASRQTAKNIKEQINSFRGIA